MPPLLKESEEPVAGPSSSEERWVIIPVEADPTTYLEKLAKLWVQYKKEYKPGVHYILSKLPEGYALLSRSRGTQPHIQDKYLYGHPSGVHFNSSLRFWTHFKHLMNGSVSPCDCDACTLQERRGTTLGADGMPQLIRRRRGKGKRPAGKGKVVGPGRPGRRREEHYLAEDEEGIQDVFKELVHKLKLRKVVDEPVVENDSMDWRAERQQLREHLTRMYMQHSFIPRVGELVLWCPELKGEVKFDFNTGTFQEVCLKTKKLLGVPKWRAGTVAQVPEELVVLGDIFFDTEKSMGINMSGFRIETFPDPNSPDKDFSSQYKYVPLSHTRPFNMWDIFLQNVPSDEFHPSIAYGLTIMSSFSMLDKYHFKGTWPDATIYCKGIYIGAELLVKGDSVRLMPENWVSGTPFGSVTDVLVIDKIVVELFNCDSDLSSPMLCEQFSPRVIGRAFTISKDRAYRDPSSLNEEPTPLTHDDVINCFETVAMRQYGPWYRLHPDGSNMEISINKIAGRCFESDYMRLMFGTKDLDLDLEGVISGRQYGRNMDNRIPEDKEWFPGDYRLETLALETFNGIEVGKYDEARDLKMWRANLRIIDGTATAADLKDAKLPREQGRSRKEHIIGGKADASKFENIGRTSSMVSIALAPPAPSTNATPNDFMSAHETGPDEDEDDDDQEEEEAEEGSSVGDVTHAPAEDSEESLDELQMDVTIFRGGTEETEGGDYEPPSSAGEPSAKRRKY
ncbi:hypothetical protein PRK78_003768 [Emydomyces testavorans]|uniref:Cryptic loci regulator 2 N-terminal domain-containing protein n=1 Tax=Emydomyces testavorans TaxID=2070801 RepID=A0AAF0IHZ1_9EURO|nr:hypothetical protein PRK78_003768 [Emydomyces testavorans]